MVTGINPVGTGADSCAAAAVGNKTVIKIALVFIAVS
jgi:hypothetical protein